MVSLGRELTISDIDKLIEDGLMRNVRGSN